MKLVTLDPEVAVSVAEHAERGAAANFSALINQAAARWAADQDLILALDELYEQDPDTRPLRKPSPKPQARSVTELLLDSNSRSRWGDKDQRVLALLETVRWWSPQHGA